MAHVKKKTVWWQIIEHQPVSSTLLKVTSERRQPITADAISPYLRFHRIRAAGCTEGQAATSECGGGVGGGEGPELSLPWDTNPGCLEFSSP